MACLHSGLLYSIEVFKIIYILKLRRQMDVSFRNQNSILEFGSFVPNAISEKVFAPSAY